MLKCLSNDLKIRRMPFIELPKCSLAASSRVEKNLVAEYLMKSQERSDKELLGNYYSGSKELLQIKFYPCPVRSISGSRCNNMTEIFLSYTVNKSTRSLIYVYRREICNGVLQFESWIVYWQLGRQKTG